MPTVYITKPAILEMVAEVLEHPEIETAWGLYGLIMDDGPVVVTGVLRPSDTDIVRRYASVDLGGSQQASAVRWLQANHRLMKKLGLSGGRFAFLYKGHSHHELGLASYSGTDEASMLEAVEKDGLEVAVGPLANLKRSGPYISQARGSILTVQGQKVWLRLYYLDQFMVEKGERKPIVIDSQIVDAAEVPVLPPLGWHLTQEAHFEEQLRHLRHFGCQVEVVYREIDGGPPFEIQFLVSKFNWRGVLSIVTKWNFPSTQPMFEVIPLEGKKATEAGDYQGSEFLRQGDLWQVGEDFIESIFRLEARGEL